MTQLRDGFGRVLDYLRVSLTDRCNFRCVYCMPEEGAEVCSKDELLSVSEFESILRAASSLGVSKVRLTGGEPTARGDLIPLLESIRPLGFQDLSLTTNGFYLPRLAGGLAKAGLNRVNISLDTLRADRFARIARRGDLGSVLEGLNAAEAAGLRPIKINCVVLRGYNEDEAIDFAKLTLERDWHVRFLEVMPIRWNLDETEGFSGAREFAGSGRIAIRIAPEKARMLDGAELRRAFVSSEETRGRIEAEFGGLEQATIQTNGPARTYRIPGAKGTVGFISQITDDLCRNCNRMRITADGFLRPCLMADGEIDLKPILRGGGTEDDLREAFLDAARHKPERHYLAEGQRVEARGMSRLGG